MFVRFQHFIIIHLLESWGGGHPNSPIVCIFLELYDVITYHKTLFRSVEVMMFNIGCKEA